jgi:hypothetical protein
MNASRLIPPRLNVLLAKHLPIAVVLARFRAKVFHVVKWNYRDGVVERGSWFQGTLYPDSSDVSFDGQHMVYAALHVKKNQVSWTAVCEPPFLKALVFWKHDSTWFGGGTFLDYRTLWLYIDEAKQPRNDARYIPSKNIQKLYRLEYLDDPVMGPTPYMKRKTRDGWIKSFLDAQEVGLEKHSSDKKFCLSIRPTGFEKPRDVRYELRDVENDACCTSIVDDETTWADWDSAGTLLVASKGILATYPKNTFPEPGICLDFNEFMLERFTEKDLLIE